MANNDYHKKSVVFAKGDPERMKLFQWLQKLGHGEFSEQTIKYWQTRMKEEKLKND